MLGNIWNSSKFAAKKLGITEFRLSYLRESGHLKPGVHWKSSPYGQKKPWNPDALYNTRMCRKIINKLFLDEKGNIAA